LPLRSRFNEARWDEICEELNDLSMEKPTLTYEPAMHITHMLGLKVG
jgi:hypothetical protein